MKLPLQIRLSIVYSAILSVVIVGLEIAGYLGTRSAIYSVVDRDLEARQAGIEDHVARHLDKGGWTKLRTALEVHPAFHPNFLRVQSEAGEAVFEGRGMAGVAIPSAAGLSTASTPGNNAMRVLTTRRLVGGTPLIFAVATDLGMPAAILRQIWWVLLFTAPPILMLCVAVGYFMSGRALAPVRRMILAAQSVDTASLNERLPVPDTGGDEIQQLAETFNLMLGRIEAGFRRISDFTADASHELRTPVAVIRASAEIALLRKQPNDAFYRETLERILRESERNSHLVENMLELSRMDSAGGVTERKPVSLGQSISEAGERMMPLAAARRVRLRCEPVAGPLDVIGDSGQLRRLCIILLDNAVKYSSAEGAVIARTGRDPEGCPFVEIADTGIGIAPEEQPRIFERFYRTDKARSRSLGGAGLGLAIARQIAGAHRATIDVTSEPGRGSRFRVTFRATNDAQPAPHRNAARLFR
jgi:heavy metal sensor kinase